MSHILVVEDEAIIRGSIKRLLTKAGYEVTEAESVEAALQLGDFDRFQLILSDLRMPGDEGTALIPYAETTPVLIMTSYASMKTAVDALQAGAADYIAKPFSNQELLSTVAKHIKSSSSASKKAVRPTPHDNLIGSSPKMKRLYKDLYKVSSTDVTVMINGETGTGKELIAKAIHLNSPRCDEAMVSVNCAAIPDTLIEAELFGHERGAFTGAETARPGLVSAAHEGTLFLDEVGELPLQAQARLLRVLQEGEVRAIGSVHPKKVDVRIVAATHRDLRQLVSEGKFREDLYYRLNVLQLVVPPLRERGVDILEIAEFLRNKYIAKFQRTEVPFSEHTKAIMLQYRWPGNVRELENAIQRGVILCEPGAEIDPESMGLFLDEDATLSKEIDLNSETPSKAPSSMRDDGDEGTDLEDYFQRFIIENQESMSETELAKRLGISRKCLWERRQKFGIPRKRTQIRPIAS